MTVPAPVLQASDLRVESAGRCLLHVPALQLARGERLAVVGPNGAGKSTLLKTLGGFMPLSAGRLQLLGRDIRSGAKPTSAAQWRRLRAEVGQLMQGLHLVPRLSALDNVVLGALARPGAVSLWRSCLRCYPAALRQEAQAALQALGLAERAGTRADRLSGGERQKVSLARLHLQRPQLVLADEPTSALDPAATLQAVAALSALAAQASLITVVHDTSLLPRLADRVLGLKQGRLAFDLPIQHVSPQLLAQLYESEPTRHAS